MTKTLKIEFRPHDCDGVYYFSISREDPPYGITSDTVRVSEFDGGQAPAREALSPYNFWMEVRKWTEGRLLNLKCNNVDLLRHFYKKYKEDSVKPHEPWPFTGAK